MKSFWWRRKLKANALYIVVSISIVVGILLLGLLTLSGVFSQAETQFLIQNKLILNVKSGLEFCLASPELPDDKVIDLFQEEKDSLRIKSRPYGILTDVELTAFHAEDSISKEVLLGNKSTRKSKTALYLANSNKALGLCGRVKLNGNVFVPERGIERSYIEGQNFVGTRLFEGVKKTAKSSLPAMHPQIMRNISDVYAVNNGSVYRDDLDTIVSESSTLVLKAEEGVFLNNVVKGKVMIVSSDFIRVSSRAELENVILKAPVVVFENGFEGSVQVFARDSIVVSEDCYLKYPSALVLKSPSKPGYSPKIVLESGSKLAGNIILQQASFNLRNNGMVTLNNEVVVNGTVYSEGYTQLRSCMVQGEVYTKKLFLKTRSSIYENTLLNVVIDPSKKDKYMIDLGIQNSERSWIYIK
ncbi:MAG: hypothetical protein CMP67_01930 [Flavobacteriales bacterium]|nr:hypothetical protein [Flavobacteriales bacterium]|tara:strand:+ start:5531 stop:6772 length:1242 start_codon:yes stop_codon:yes gene_type:complete